MRNIFVTPKSLSGDVRHAGVTLAKTTEEIGDVAIRVTGEAMIDIYKNEAGTVITATTENFKVDVISESRFK